MSFQSLIQSFTAGPPCSSTKVGFFTLSRGCLESCLYGRGLREALAVRTRLAGIENIREVRSGLEVRSSGRQ